MINELFEIRQILCVYKHWDIFYFESRFFKQRSDIFQYLNCVKFSEMTAEFCKQLNDMFHLPLFGLCHIIGLQFLLPFSHLATMLEG